MFAACGEHDTELFTYSASTSVRTALLAAGFVVGRGVPTGTKPETTLAMTPSAALRSVARGRVLKHGVDFVDALEVFADPLRVERLDQRREYPEVRRQVVGIVRGQMLFVVYTCRGEVRRLISSRRASSDERKAYHTRGGRAGR